MSTVLHQEILDKIGICIGRLEKIHRELNAYDVISALQSKLPEQPKSNFDHNREVYKVRCDFLEQMIELLKKLREQLQGSQSEFILKSIESCLGAMSTALAEIIQDLLPLLERDFSKFWSEIHIHLNPLNPTNWGNWYQQLSSVQLRLKMDASLFLSEEAPKLVGQARAHSKAIDELRQKAEEIVGVMADKPAQQAFLAQGGTFDAESKHHKHWSWFWLGISVLALLGASVMAGRLWMHWNSEQIGLHEKSVIYYLNRATISALFVALISVCYSNYRRHKNLQILYTHKVGVLSVYSKLIFYGPIEKYPDLQGRLMEYVAKIVFDLDSTGFVASSGAPESLPTMIDLLKLAQNNKN